MRIVALFFALLSCTSGAAQAQPLYGKPTYDPSSKSYFELVKVSKEEVPGSHSPALAFDKAAKAASGRVFKGAKGRLAIIRSSDTHLMIMQKLRPNEDTWIGLRYLCKQRQLRWVNGDLLQPGQFTAWHERWDQSGIAGCVKGSGEGDWMPVAYTPAGAGFRWVAKGALKIYVAYLVEYPTGGE